MPRRRDLLAGVADRIWQQPPPAVLQPSSLASHFHFCLLGVARTHAHTYTRTSTRAHLPGRQPLQEGAGLPGGRHRRQRLPELQREGGPEQAEKAGKAQTAAGLVDGRARALKPPFILRNTPPPPQLRTCRLTCTGPGGAEATQARTAVEAAVSTVRPKPGTSATGGGRSKNQRVKPPKILVCAVARHQAGDWIYYVSGLV